MSNPDGRAGAESLPEEPSALALAVALVRGRKIIGVMGLAGLLLGAVIPLVLRREYVAAATFIPQTGTDQSGAGGLALAASQLGIRVPTGGGGWAAPIYVELLTSQGLLRLIATDTVQVVEQGNSRIAIADLLEVDPGPPGKRTEETVRALRRVISAAEEKRLGAARLRVTTRWPSVSLALANRLLFEVNQFNLKTRQSQASAERTFAENQAGEAERLLRDAEDRMQGFLQRNKVVSSPALAFDQERLQREITLRQQSYLSLLQSYSEARLREVRDTPVFTLLEAPVLPVLGESRQVALKGMAGAIAGVMLGMIASLVASARTSSSGRLREFFQVVEESLPRFLRRWM